MVNKIQMRGHCQCCGRIQAVIAGSGLMSKHGYKVSEHGWFVGVCSGQNHRPLQVDRAHADATVAWVRKEIETMLKPKLADLVSGKQHPEYCKGSYNVRAREYDKVPWADASTWQRDDARRAAIFGLEQRIKAGESFANDLEKLSDQVHGTALIEVKAADGPEPIKCGDKRQAQRGVLTAQSIYRGMVHWKDEKGFGSKMSTRAWRLLPKA